MRLLSLLMLFVLAACGGNVRQTERAVYDLSGAVPLWKPKEVAIADVAVRAPTWLSGPEISYRLLYAGDMRRNAYADSRWAAPPAELIQHALNRQAAAGVAGCLLRIDIDDLVQVFDTPQASRVVLDAKVALMAPGSDALLARKSLSIAQAAPSPDARGSVAGTTSAVQALGAELNTWIVDLARNSSALAQRCNGR